MGKLTFWALVRCSRLTKWWWHNIGGNMESKFLAVSNIFDGKEPQLAGGNQMVISSITEDLNSSKKHTRLVVSAGLESRIAALRVRHAAYSWYYARTTTRVNRCMKGINRLLGDLECQFKCISANTIYYTICTLCEKVYNGATSRKLRDRFREHV